MITATIDAHKRINVAVFEIPGAYLHTETDENTFIVLEGVLSELIMKVDPLRYHKYFTMNRKGKSFLYVKIHKPFYGILRSALLCHHKLVRDLEAFSFELNPYDPCLENKMVNVSQMIAVWHMNDLKASRPDNSEITKLTC